MPSVEIFLLLGDIALSVIGMGTTIAIAALEGTCRSACCGNTMSHEDAEAGRIREEEETKRSGMTPHTSIRISPPPSPGNLFLRAPSPLNVRYTKSEGVLGLSRSHSNPEMRQS